MADKEITRLLGSTTYLTNVGFGLILAVALGIVSLFVGLDKLIATTLQGAPVTVEMVLPALPFFIYFMTGMVPTTACSPSLEGNNYWILKSSPIKNRDIYLGKILANLYIAVPAQLLGTLFICISAKASFLTTVTFLLLGVVLCIFSSVFGCACGVRFMRLDWENEIEVIKQGTAVVIYLFPNMIITCLLLVGSVFLANAVGIIPGTVVIMTVYAVLAVIFYFRTMKLAKER
jgi:ABC-2 type transport system permease protein